MVDQPSEGDFENGQVVFGDDGLDDFEGIECGVLEITLPVMGIRTK